MPPHTGRHRHVALAHEPPHASLDAVVDEAARDHVRNDDERGTRRKRRQDVVEPRERRRAEHRDPFGARGTRDALQMTRDRRIAAGLRGEHDRRSGRCDLGDAGADDVRDPRVRADGFDDAERSGGLRCRGDELGEVVARQEEERNDDRGEGLVRAVPGDGREQAREGRLKVAGKAEPGRLVEPEASDEIGDVLVRARRRAAVGDEDEPHRWKIHRAVAAGVAGYTLSAMRLPPALHRCVPRGVEAGRCRVRGLASVLALAAAVVASPIATGQYFLPSRHCSGCHPIHHGDWKGSAHANAFTNAAFQARLKDYVSSGGSEDACLRCHAPLALQRLWTWSGYRELYRSEGVTCDVCHRIGDACVQDGTGRYELDDGRARRARLPGAEARLHDGTIRHEGAYSELHGRSELCASCHERADAHEPIHTYAEWQASGAEATCQGCHLQGSPGFASVWSTSPRRPRVTLHTFEAPSGEPRLHLRERGDGLLVEIRNTSSAHHLPTGGRHLRLRVEDRVGTTIFTRLWGRTASASIAPGATERLLLEMEDAGRVVLESLSDLSNDGRCDLLEEARPR